MKEIEKLTEQNKKLKENLSDILKTLQELVKSAGDSKKVREYVEKLIKDLQKANEATTSGGRRGRD